MDYNMCLQLVLTTTLCVLDTFALFENGLILWTAASCNAWRLGCMVHCRARANPFAIAPDLSTRARIFKQKYNKILFYTSYLSSQLQWHGNYFHIGGTRTSGESSPLCRAPSACLGGQTVYLNLCPQCSRQWEMDNWSSVYVLYIEMFYLLRENERNERQTWHNREPHKKVKDQKIKVPRVEIVPQVEGSLNQECKKISCDKFSGGCINGYGQHNLTYNM